jgi:hypothetical protein
MISTAVMPPSDRPASADFSAGIWSSSQAAVVSQLSKMPRGGLRPVRHDDLRHVAKVGELGRVV